MLSIRPLPVVFSAVASAFLHDILGQTRQTLAGVDFDWLPRPGLRVLRVYGGLLLGQSPGVAENGPPARVFLGH